MIANKRIDDNIITLKSKYNFSSNFLESFASKTPKNIDPSINTAVVKAVPIKKQVSSRTIIPIMTGEMTTERIMSGIPINETYQYDTPIIPKKKYEKLQIKHDKVGVTICNNCLLDPTYDIIIIKATKGITITLPAIDEPNYKNTNVIVNTKEIVIISSFMTHDEELHTISCNTNSNNILFNGSTEFKIGRGEAVRLCPIDGIWYTI